MKIFRTPMIFKWIFPRRHWGFSSSNNSVYLTFDDGPTSELTSWILDYLESENIKATFFCVGANAQKFPSLIDEIKSKGHVIGNHTMHHEKGTKTKKSDYLASINEAAKHIDSNLFRPPYGRLPWTYTRSIAKNYKIIMWSWLSYDYDHTVSVDKIIEEADDIYPGDILVVHDNVKMLDRIQVILPKLVEVIKKKGLKFEVISAS